MIDIDKDHLWCGLPIAFVLQVAKVLRYRKKAFCISAILNSRVFSWVGRQNLMSDVLFYVLFLCHFTYYSFSVQLDLSVSYCNSF